MAMKFLQLLFFFSFQLRLSFSGEQSFFHFSLSICNYFNLFPIYATFSGCDRFWLLLYVWLLRNSMSENGNLVCYMLFSTLSFSYFSHLSHESFASNLHNIYLANLSTYLILIWNATAVCSCWVSDLIHCVILEYSISMKWFFLLRSKKDFAISNL